MDNFVEACRYICTAKQGTRWPKLLRDVFKEAKVLHLLPEQDSVASLTQEPPNPLSSHDHMAQ